MSHFTSTSRKIFFTSAVICVKWHLSDDGSRIAGQTSLYQGTFKRRIGEKKEEFEVKTEKERVEVLEKEFGIVLGEAEKKGILGMVSALPSS